jgi:hypothetical protein
MKHDWTINAISEGESWMAGVVATCRRCGTIRTKAVSTAATDDRIDLTGDCLEDEPAERSEPFIKFGRERGTSD